MTIQNPPAGSAYTPGELSERAIYRRAVEAAIWGMAAVNYRLMYQEMVDKVKGGYNQIVYWSRLLDWKNQTRTQGYALLRSVLKSGSDADVAKAVAYARRIKLYPLSRAAAPPPTTFAPDAKTKTILAEAIGEARAWFEARYDIIPPFYDGRRWFFPSTEEMIQNVMKDWHVPDSYPIDARGTAYSLAFFSAKHLGESQYYLLAGRDKNGNELEGGSNYRLNVPAHVPVTQYWSMTVYNRDTHAFIMNAVRVGRSSQSPGLQTNADGSVDIYFGPKAPAVDARRRTGGRVHEAARDLKGNRCGE